MASARERRNRRCGSAAPPGAVGLPRTAAWLGAARPVQHQLAATLTGRRMSRRELGPVEDQPPLDVGPTQRFDLRRGAPRRHRVPQADRQRPARHDSRPPPRNVNGQPLAPGRGDDRIHGKTPKMSSSRSRRPGETAWPHRLRVRQAPGGRAGPNVPDGAGPFAPSRHLDRERTVDARRPAVRLRQDGACAGSKPTPDPSAVWSRRRRKGPRA